MESKINLALLETYLRVTGQTELIFNLLLDQYVSQVDNVSVEYNYQTALLALAFISTKHKYPNYSCSVYSTSAQLTIGITDKDRDVLQLHISKESTTVTHPQTSWVYPTPDGQDIIQLLGNIVADTPSLNAPLDNIQEIIELLMYVQSLAFPSYPLDPFEILVGKRNQLEKIVEDIKLTMVRFERLGDEEEPTPHQEQPTHVQTPVIEDTIVPDSSVFDLDQVIKNITNLGLIAAQVIEQTKLNIAIDTTQKDRIILTKRYDDGLVLSTILQIVESTLLLVLDLSTDMEPVTQVSETIDPATTQTLARGILDIIPRHLSFIQAKQGTRVGDDMGAFITQIATILLSGANPEDIHLPQEEVVTSSEADTTMIKIWAKAKQVFRDTVIFFEQSRQVIIANQTGDHVSHGPFEGYLEDDVIFMVNSFPELISVAYATDLIINSKSHTVERHLKFVESYIDELVSVNWDTEVFSTMSVTPSKNKANWVTAYGIDKKLPKLLHQYSKITEHSASSLGLDFDPKLPATLDLVDLRKHINDSKMLLQLKEGLTTFNSHSSDETVTTCRYLNVVSQNASTESRLVLYIENSEQKITVIPIYTVGETGRVDSINIFTFIRESEWPSLILYLDNIVKGGIEVTA